MGQPLRHAWAAIRRNPLLALVSVLTLTLGIGLNAGVFTVVDGLMFRARVQKIRRASCTCRRAIGERQRGRRRRGRFSTRDCRTLATGANPAVSGGLGYRAGGGAPGGAATRAGG
jgi:hypothetical protein